MDTSEQYINMCRKATELQEMWKPKEGDWFHDGTEARALGDSFYLGKFNNASEIYDRPAWDGTGTPIQTTVWLFRIDQLITLSGMPWQEFLFEVVEYSAGVSESAEIAALHSLMELLYKKEWNGEDWILISENIN